MPYTPTNWVDGVTPVNAVNLNKLENGLAAGGIPADVVVTPATALLLRSRYLVGDAQPAFRLNADGRMQWGVGGSTAIDTELSRVGANLLYTGGGLTLGGLVSPLAVYLGAAAAGATVVHARASGDGQNRLSVNNQGLLSWGDGTAVADTNLYRVAANILATDDVFRTYAQFESIHAVAGGAILQAAVGAEPNYRFIMGQNGELTWGPGSAATDTNLYRSAAGTLKTDGGFVAVGGAPGVGLFYQPATAVGYLAASRVGAEGNSRFHIAVDGYMAWGVGTAGVDTKLYRLLPGYLKTDGAFVAGGQIFVGNAVDGTTAANGLYFGTSQDTKLYRSAAGYLKTDGMLQVGLSLMVDQQDAGQKIFFGSALDTNLYRSAAGVLKTDGQIEVGATGVKFSDGSVQTTAGSMVLIQEIILGADANIDFTSIPQTFRHLRLEGSVRGADTTNRGDILRVIFNNDSGGSNYEYNGDAGSGLAGRMDLARITGGNTAMNGQANSRFVIEIPYYTSGGGGCACAIGEYSARTNDGGTGADVVTGTSGGVWLGGTGLGVTRITLNSSFGTTALKAGSKVALYGIV